MSWIKIIIFFAVIGTVIFLIARQSKNNILTIRD